MPEHRDENLIDRVAAELRAAPRLDPSLDQRIMAAVRAEPRPVPARPIVAAWHWLSAPRSFRLSPLMGLAAAAGLVGAIWLAAPRVNRSPSPGASSHRIPTYAVEFVLTAPAARSVVVVGDFNDWDPAATPLTAVGHGVWTATVALPAGRHRYAFLLDGRRWIADPGAPPAADDDFDSPNSVVTLGT